MGSTHLARRKGFTLIELVVVMVVLGIVAVGISGFIRNSLSIYTDVTERDQLVSDSRFLVERLTRELRQAIPNSVRANIFGTQQCVEFIPALWVSYYTSLSVLPDSSHQGNIIRVAGNPVGYLPTAGDNAVVYPINTDAVYDTNNNHRLTVLDCSEASVSADDDCSTADEATNTATLSFSGAFSDNSPASRMYFARTATSYCANSSNGQVWRYQTNIVNPQVLPSSGGVLMAESLSTAQPFTVSDPTLTRTGLVMARLDFTRNEQVVNYNVEVHIPNVP